MPGRTGSTRYRDPGAYGGKKRRPPGHRVVLLKRAAKGGVTFVGFASAVLSFTTFGLSKTVVGITVLSIFLLLSLFANGMLLLESRMQSNGLKQIAFLTPSSGGQPFYTAMLSGLVQSASLAHGQDYLVVPSMSSQSFEAVSIWALFASLEDRQVDIHGIIFIPDQPDRHFEELVGFHEERGDVPLVLVDVYFDLSACDDRTRARLPSFVGGDELVGGALAADIILHAVGESRGPSAVVLIIHGGTAPWERQRATACRERLRQTWQSATFIDSPSFNYSRTAAFGFVVRMLKSRAGEERVLRLDAVFACNDDMAIGARGAISRLVREGYTFENPPQIVGYDGIPEIREYIDSHDSYIAGTVDVRVEEQARAAMLLMHKLLRTGQRKSEIELIAPVAIRRESN